MEIVLILFLLVLIEYIFSLYKKDGIYSKKSTLVNVFTQFFGVLKDITIPFLGILSIFTLLNNHVFHIFNLPENLFVLLLCLILMDFLYYLFHRVSHATKFFWMFHFVHHSDRSLNLSVGFRSSFFEILGLFLFYSPLLLLGIPIKVFLLAFSITSTYQFLTHSRYIKLPRVLSYILVIPKHHLIHHDEDIRYQNSNFSGVFIIWDKFFNTYTKEIASFTPGIKGYIQNNIIKIHTDPIRTILKI